MSLYNINFLLQCRPRWKPSYTYWAPVKSANMLFKKPEDDTSNDGNM
jgi:hypothetical protein